MLELAALAGVALWALAFQLRLPGRLPTEADWRAAGQAFESEARTGDVVLLFPWWTERARLFVPRGLPVVGYQGSDGDPLAGHPRIWVLAQAGLPRADVAGFERAFLPGRTRLGEERAFGPLRLALYRNGRHRRTLFSATGSFAQARVYLEQPGGERTSCPFDGKAHRCPGPGGVHVAPEWHEIGLQPRRCLWFHPPGGATRLVAELPAVPAGERLSLEGGLVWDRGYHRGPQYTVTRLGVDDAATGERLLELPIPAGLAGLQRAAVQGSASGPARALKLWSQSDSAELRDVCLELLSQGAEGEEGA